MAWTTAVEEVRNQISDGAIDKLRYRKRCFGKVDGTNLIFKTLEDHRITDLTNADAPQGVYVDGAKVDVDADFPDLGEFTLKTAPDDGQEVEATYYIQWFTDPEIEKLLGASSQWLGFGLTYTNLPPGLQYAAMLYACKLACEKMALRSVDYVSDVYQVSEAPRPEDKQAGLSYASLARDYFKQASEARKDYYTRNDMAEAPLFANISGCVRDVPPKR